MGAFLVDLVGYSEQRRETARVNTAEESMRIPTDQMSVRVQTSFRNDFENTHSQRNRKDAEKMQKNLPFFVVDKH